MLSLELNLIIDESPIDIISLINILYKVVGIGLFGEFKRTEPKMDQVNN